MTNSRRIEILAKIQNEKAKKKNLRQKSKTEFFSSNRKAAEKKSYINENKKLQK